MKSLLASTSLAALIGGSAAMADPTFMLGGTLLLDGSGSPQFGVTGKVLSNNEEDEFAFGAGASYYFSSGEFGLDGSVGYLFDSTAVTFGYDFLQNGFAFGLGFADTEDEETSSPPAPVPVAPPPPSPPR